MITLVQPMGQNKKSALWVQSGNKLLILFLERKSIKKNFNALSNPQHILDFCPVTIVRFLSRNRMNIILIRC